MPMSVGKIVMMVEQIDRFAHSTRVMNYRQKESCGYVEGWLKQFVKSVGDNAPLDVSSEIDMDEAAVQIMQ